MEPNPGISLEDKRKYDLRVTLPSGKSYTLECKLDLLSMVTGRIAVEREALNHSSADYFGYTICIPFLVPKEQLDWLAYSPDFRYVPGGDNGGIMTLIPTNDEYFLKSFKHIKPKR